MWKPPELSVSGGFFLIVGWFAVSCGGEAALLVLSAALLHELGHILALRPKRVWIAMPLWRICAIALLKE